MRIVFIGCVEFSKSVLQRLLSLKADVVGVLTKKHSDFNADFCDLSAICKKSAIPYKYVADINNKENINFIKKLKPDIIFCFGFSQILNDSILNLAPMGIVGYHPAALPKNRGRHPIIWALALGLKETGSTFFFMDKGADNGDILDQAKVKITYRDDAATLYSKITETAVKQIERFLPKLQNGSYKRTTQDNFSANVWRKRDEYDGLIDFRMGSRAIYNLVRALTRPYIGAHVFYDNKPVKIWKVKEARPPSDNIEYGKVIGVKNRQIFVKCYDNAVLITKHEFSKLPKQGEYLR